MRPKASAFRKISSEKSGASGDCDDDDDDDDDDDGCHKNGKTSKAKSVACFFFRRVVFRKNQRLDAFL